MDILDIKTNEILTCIKLQTILRNENNIKIFVWIIINVKQKRGIHYHYRKHKITFITDKFIARSLKLSIVLSVNYLF